MEMSQREFSSKDLIAILPEQSCRDLCVIQYVAVYFRRSTLVSEQTIATIDYRVTLLLLPNKSRAKIKLKHAQGGLVLKLAVD